MKLSEEHRAQLRSNLDIVELRKVQHDGIIIPKIDGRDGEEFWSNVVEERPADLYVIDPFRYLHGGNENDSAIAETLAAIRRIFKRAVIIPHHMVKRSRNPKENVRLNENMRLWSEGCRGSGVIKGHADVIVCQERLMEGDTEVVYLGAIMKDAPDADPMPLEEASPESFLWIPQRKLPTELRTSLQILESSGSESWDSQATVCKILMSSGQTRPTAYRHFKNLIQRRCLRMRGDKSVELTKEPLVMEEVAV